MRTCSRNTIRFAKFFSEWNKINFVDFPSWGPLLGILPDLSEIYFFSLRKKLSKSGCIPRTGPHEGKSTKFILFYSEKKINKSGSIPRTGPHEENQRNWFFISLRNFFIKYDRIPRRGPHEEKINGIDFMSLRKKIIKSGSIPRRGPHEGKSTKFILFHSEKNLANRVVFLEQVLMRGNQRNIFYFTQKKT